MIDRVPAWSLRADLVRQQIRMGGEAYWILQDPLSRQMHYLDSREYSLLELLDGRRTLTELTRECRQRFAPDYLSGEAVVAFLADAKRRGLVVGGASSELTRAQSTTQDQSWWKQPLAIRLPGINPEPFLDPLLSQIRPFFNPAFATILVGLVLFAAALVVTQFGLLSEHVAIAAHRHGPSWLLVLAIVIGATKIIHELAHAIACKAFGAECRNIGIMFLVGIPCLYCDVSDAWMLPQRWKRIIISAAGMAVELSIAAIATLLWWFSADGEVRDLCVTVMVVCSVSTILFNGNPLLRYDGYFILSDLVGIPNLSTQARTVLDKSIRRILWGSAVMLETEPLKDAGSASTKNRFLLAYSVASGLYRTFILATIIYLLYRIAENQGMGKVAGLIALTMITIIAAKRIIGLSKRPNSFATSRSTRPRLIVAMAFASILAVLLIPLPQTVVAPGMIHPAESHSIYATVAGRLTESVRYGDEVKQKETIARLENADAQQEHLRLQAQCERLELQLDGLQKTRGGNPVASAKIPAVTETLRSAQHQRSLHQRQMDNLAIKAPIDGTIYAADEVYREAVFTGERSDTHGLLPLSPNQSGGWIQPGTTICVVGHSRHRELLLWVRQQDIPFLRPDQTIRLLLPDYPKEAIHGQLTHIATEPVETVERELTVAGLIELQPGDEQERKPRETFYQVRAKLEDNAADLPIRLTTRAKVSVDPASLLSRISRWISDAFRFRS